MVGNDVFGIDVNIKSAKFLREGDVLILGGENWDFHSHDFSNGEIVFEKGEKTISFSQAAVEDFINKIMVFRPTLSRIKLNPSNTLTR